MYVTNKWETATRRVETFCERTYQQHLGEKSRKEPVIYCQRKEGGGILLKSHFCGLRTYGTKQN